MSINAIWEALKGIAQSLQVATFFPSFLFVVINASMILPQFNILREDQITSPSGVAIATTLTLILSYTLYAFNFPMIRFVEGYVKKPRIFWNGLLAEKIRKHRALVKRIDSQKDKLGIYENKIDPETSLYWQDLKSKLLQTQSEFEQTFPLSEAAVLPTALGNVIAAFEDYSRTHYGIDSVTLWPRLIPVIKESRYLDFVVQEKLVFDFLLNTGLVFIVLGTELVYMNVFLEHIDAGLFLFALTLMGMMVFYVGLIYAAQQWGSTVRVAFDLHRHQLRKSLKLRPVSKFAEEPERWEQVSEFLATRPIAPDRFTEFINEPDLEKEKSNPNPGRPQSPSE